MLIRDHRTEIDHIVQHLEQIEISRFDSNVPMSPMAQTRVLAKEVMEEFMSLLKNLEVEEFEHRGIIYDTKMIGDMCLLAYYLSCYDHQKLFDINMSLEETCNVCAGIIGCNPEAMIHIKSNYDIYFDNSNRGVKQTIVLNSDMIRTMNTWGTSTEEALLAECRRCLSHRESPVK